VLETIASDPGLQQAELVFLGLFGRACRILDSRDSQVRYAPPSPRCLGSARVPSELLGRRQLLLPHAQQNHC